MSDIATIGLNGIVTAIKLMRAGQAHSLIDYAKATRVQPLCLVGSDMLFEAATPEIMQSLLSTFAGFYLQAVAVSTTVGRISVLEKLERLNPNRDMLSDAAYWDNFDVQFEAHSNKLPDYTKSHAQLSLEARQACLSMETDSVEVTWGDKNKAGGVKIDQKAIDSVAKEAANLSVGKVIGVEISDGGQKATIPVAIRLMVNSVPTAELAHILSLGSKDKTWLGRWRAYKSGEIDFWKDLVMAQDLITAHRKNLMNDSTGHYTDISQRKTNNGIMGMLDMKPSLGTISNLAVISKDTQAELELAINGSLNNPRVRNSIFEHTALMILAVYDKDYDRVTIYYHGIAEKTELGVRDLRNSNKGDGPNITDFLKAFASGGAPAF
jgi:hypothetical protein